MNKNVKALLVVFAALLIVALFPTLKKSFTKDQPETVKKTSVDLTDFSKESVQKVTIKSGEETKTLMLSGGTWKIDGEDTDPIQTDLFFDGLAEAQTIKLVSKNQDNHAKFDVTKETATLLTFAGEDEDTTFFIGKEGPEINSFYIRKEGIANVYLVRGNLQSKVTQDALAWKPAAQEEVGETDDTLKTEDIIGN